MARGCGRPGSAAVFTKDWLACVTRRFFTISDVDGFTRLVGIAQFFFKAGQLRFNVHLEAAKQARRQISSRLLTLATIQ